MRGVDKVVGPQPGGHKQGALRLNGLDHGTAVFRRQRMLAPGFFIPAGQFLIAAFQKQKLVISSLGF